MAWRMNTSRAALDRLLDPANPSVTLQTQKGPHLCLESVCKSNWCDFWGQCKSIVSSNPILSASPKLLRRFEGAFCFAVHPHIYLREIRDA